MKREAWLITEKSVNYHQSFHRREGQGRAGPGHKHVSQSHLRSSQYGIDEQLSDLLSVIQRLKKLKTKMYC